MLPFWERLLLKLMCANWELLIWIHTCAPKMSDLFNVSVKSPVQFLLVEPESTVLLFRSEAVCP